MLAPGTYLGRYAIREHLGAGGMGEVYLAHDPRLGRNVAIKVLPEDFAYNPERLARFEREALAVSALNHPNILTIHDFGEEAGNHFMVAEYIDGRTLREWSSEARPPLAALLEALAQAASALAAAHRAGIVHRDIKPENLMRRHDGFVKVLDFGIAKLAASPGGGPVAAAHTDPDQTRPGTIFGTTRYMSPEQALGVAVDARSDVWSLGVVLYELVAGIPPFEGSTPMGTLAMIMEREPLPLDQTAPGTPEAVCRIVRRALRKHPFERYESAAEMAADLARAARELDGGDERVLDQDFVGTISFELPGTPALDATTPATNLPSRVSSLVGRERELAEITAVLLADDVRLVTLTGAGGTGKTRLAVEAGRQLLARFPDGVFAVDLSTLSDPDGLAAFVAGVFRLKESGNTIGAELSRFLARKRMLLVLDNFEQLVAGASFVTELLAAAPGVKALVTSRALLRLQGEREYALEPLAVPIFASLPPVDELASTPAVALFVERARAVRPSFALTADNARTVVEICRRLDGLPLAIELAAARIKLLAPQAMLDRLDQRLKLLTGGARDLPARQQTMRGAVAWSYDLLDDAEKSVLRRLAVFAGGCVLDAAEAVCETTGVDVLDAVGSLVDKSLVRQRELDDGEMRFALLEVVREYALEQLEAAGEADEARLAHARFYLRLADEARPHMWAEDQPAWLRRLRHDSDNLLAAIAPLMERAPVDGTALVLHLGSFWQILGQYSLRRAWHLRALETDPAPDVRARLLHGLGNCELHLGNLVAAADYAQQSVVACREFGERRTLALALNGLGQALLQVDDAAGARAAQLEGLAIARELGDGMLAAVFLNSLGEVGRSAGEFGSARATYEEAIDACGRGSRSNLTAISLLNLGGACMELRDFAAAASNFRDSLVIAADLQSPSLIADGLDGLAAVSVEAGNPNRAARLAAAADVLYEATGEVREPFEQRLRDRYEAVLRASLDADALKLELSSGRAMTLDEAIAVALAE